MARQAIDLIPYDFESHAESLIRYLQVNLPNEYQDFLESQAVRVLVDAIAYEMGLLAFMMNANLKQMFVSTATTRRAMFYLGKLVNYDIRGAIPSAVLLRFSIDDPHLENILIPKGTQVQAPGTNPVIFETNIDAILAAGELFIDVTAQQGVTKKETIGVTATSAVPNQQFVNTEPTLIDTIILTINDIPWTRVDNIFDLIEGQLGYTAKPNEEGLAVITFGNGLFGAIPPNNSEIDLEYRIGGGLDTNVPSGQIIELLTNLFDEIGSIVQVRVTNIAAASGGLDEESIEESRVNIPRAVRSMDRFVSREDFQKVPEVFHDAVLGTVFKSNATVKYIWADHIITIFILGDPPAGRLTAPTIPSQALLDAVREYIEDRTLPTIAISVEPARHYPVDVIGTVYFLPNFRQETVQENVLQALADQVFNNCLREIGDGLRLSDVYAAIDGARGVDYCDLTTPTGNVGILGDEFIIAGTINLTYVRLPRTST